MSAQYVILFVVVLVIDQYIKRWIMSVGLSVTYVTSPNCNVYSGNESLVYAHTRRLIPIMPCISTAYMVAVVGV